MTVQAAQIAKLNDRLRETLRGGQILVTAGVNALGEIAVRAILAKVRSFSRFDESNDPHNEHDFGDLDYLDIKVLWKIDYYDRTMRFLSPNPADNLVTVRVLTVMLASEY